MSATVFQGPLGPALLKVIGRVPGPEEVAAVAALLVASSAVRRPPEARSRRLCEARSR
ncbi:hypothetical protein [Streptomyces sp. DH24]|uniref:hypothetical protein n=1 Tax=Streptomyces sp. DH24 TaxID=3040123 RepID=UPI0024422C00|nr:hypothetical protein [Streptomyces sp. DH24]MDG9720224.1 hypothetical protein [Streptomyces sp. DH24]